MVRNPNNLYLFQVIVAVCVLIQVSIGFITIWTTIYQLLPAEGKKPGFNLKEI